jgi:hypothetical protein
MNYVILLLCFTTTLLTECRGKGVFKNVDWCELNLNSSGEYVKGIYSPLAATHCYLEYGECDIEFTFEVTNFTNPCKFLLQHESEPSPKVLTWKSKEGQEWQLKDQPQSAIKIIKTIPISNQSEYEGKYTLTLKDNVTTQFYVIFDGPKNISEVKYVPTFESHSFHLNVTVQPSFKTCLDFNQHFQPEVNFSHFISCDSSINSRCTVARFLTDQSSFEIEGSLSFSRYILLEHPLVTLSDFLAVLAM